MRIKPSQVTKNAGKIQNFLTNLGLNMAETSSGYSTIGEGYRSKEEIAHSIMHAEQDAANRLGIKNEQEQYYNQQHVQYQQMPEPYYPGNMMPSYPVSQPQFTNFTNNFNYTIEEDMENVDISKYIGAPKKEQPKPVNGDMGALVKEMRETNKKLEAMCKILGLIYQQNVKNNTLAPADFGFAESELNHHSNQEEDEMSPAEETEMLNNLPSLPVVDPMAEDDTEQ